jgi:hypothetical protein
MAAIDEKLLKTCDNGTAQSLLASLDMDGLPYRTRVSLIEQSGSLTITVPADSWADTEHSLSDPGTAEVYYYRDGVLVVDLDA